MRQVFICFRPGTPTPPYTLYTCILCTSLHREEGRVEPERRLEGQQFTKLGRKYQRDWMYLESINSDKHLPFIYMSIYFRWRHILLWCLYSYLVHAYSASYMKNHSIDNYCQDSSCILTFLTEWMVSKPLIQIKIYSWSIC